VCFELFRYTEGSFEFEPDRRPSWQAERSVDVGGLVAETERRMAEWREIIAVIPSIEARPRLVPEPPAGGPITLDAAQWRVVTGIDGRRRVSALIRVLDGGEFTVCKTLRSLVQAGLVEIEAAEPGATPAPAESPAAAAVRDSAEADTEDGRPAPKPVRERPARVEETEPAPAAEDPLADGLDRGAVVALLTSARTK
jgi:hypothetical protein